MLNLKRLIKIFFLYFFLLSICNAEPIDYSKEITLNIVKIKKRNSAGCKRLGNIYGWCEWVAFLKVNNNLDKPLRYICSNLSINKKKYQICLGKNSKKYVMPSKNYKTFLLDLNKLVNYSNNNKKPNITLQTISFKL